MNIINNRLFDTFLEISTTGIGEALASSQIGIRLSCTYKAMGVSADWGDMVRTLAALACLRSGTHIILVDICRNLICTLMRSKVYAWQSSCIALILLWSSISNHIRVQNNRNRSRIQSFWLCHQPFPNTLPKFVLSNQSMKQKQSKPLSIVCGCLFNLNIIQ